MSSGWARELRCRPLVDRRGDTAPASWARRGGRAAARETALVALSVHGYQAIPLKQEKGLGSVAAPALLPDGG
jgi:hypothetical protein